MKKTLAFMAVMLLSAMSMVSATWFEQTGPAPIKQIVEPTFPVMPEKVYISGLTGNFVDTHYAIGGWYYDSGWALEDFQHTTAQVTVAACTTGVESYISNYMDSGTEASGNAWKYADMSLLNQQGGQNTINNKVVAWTVNSVPPGGDYTSFFYEEFTGNLESGVVTHNLVVEGDAEGDISSPTVIQTEYTSGNDLFQQRATGININ